MRTIAAIALLLLASANASANYPMLVNGLDLPGDARPLATAYDTARETLLIGTYANSSRPELYAVKFGPSGNVPQIVWSTEIGGNVDSIVTDGTYAYLATSSNSAEFVIVDLTTGATGGSYDAAGSADGIHVSIEAPGVVTLDRRLSACPERYRLNVSNPSSIVVLSSEQCSTEVPWPAAEATSEVWAYGGFLVSETKRATARGVVYYGVTRGQTIDLSVVERTIPVTFADVNHDGVYRIGCVGDSNTANPTVSWCAITRATLSDPQVETVNVAVSGATAVAPNLYPNVTSTSEMQMATVLPTHPDAVVLAFGTNDAFQGRTPMQIAAALVAAQDTAAAQGVAFYVALTPPILGCIPTGCPGLQAINDAVIAAFDADQIIDFWSDMPADGFYSDGFHFNSVGQTVRADRVLDVIGNPALR